MDRESGSLKPNFAIWALPARMFRVLVAEEFPIPPWYYRRSEHPMWSWNCSKVACNGAAHFGYSRCPRHYRMSDSRIVLMFARLAKVFIWAGALHLRGLLIELEDDEKWTRLQYISLAPIVIDMISRMNEVTKDLDEVKFGLLKAGIPKRSKENLAYWDAMVVAGERAVNFYLDPVTPENTGQGLSNMYRLEQLAILIEWSCEYVERFVEWKQYG